MLSTATPCLRSMYGSRREPTPQPATPEGSARRQKSHGGIFVRCSAERICELDHTRLSRPVSSGSSIEAVDQRICEFYEMLVCFSTPSSLMQSWRFEIFGSSLMILSLVPKSRLTRGWKASQVFENIGGCAGTRPPGPPACEADGHGTQPSCSRCVCDMNACPCSGGDGAAESTERRSLPRSLPQRSRPSNVGLSGPICRVICREADPTRHQFVIWNQ